MPAGQAATSGLLLWPADVVTAICTYQCVYRQLTTLLCACPLVFVCCCPPPVPQTLPR